MVLNFLLYKAVRRNPKIRVSLYKTSHFLGKIAIQFSAKVLYCGIQLSGWISKLRFPQPFLGRRAGMPVPQEFIVGCITARDNLFLLAIRGCRNAP